MYELVVMKHAALETTSLALLDEEEAQGELTLAPSHLQGFLQCWDQQMLSSAETGWLSHPAFRTIRQDTFYL